MNEPLKETIRQQREAIKRLEADRDHWKQVAEDRERMREAFERTLQDVLVTLPDKIVDRILRAQQS